MRILWLSGNPSLYSKHQKGYNSGGWIGALESIIKKQKGIELGIAFFYNDNCFKNIIEGTTYYPISLYNSKIEKIKHNLFYERFDEVEIAKIKKIVDDFQPDIIHVWGTEISFGLVANKTNIPVVIHIQGILNPVYNSFLIPGISRNSYLRNHKNPLKWISNAQTLRFWSHNTKREIEIFQGCTSFIGRTHWDKSIMNLLSPNSKYFYCSELLRSPFYHSPKWKQHRRDKLVISSVLSSPSYKGIDLVLKTAEIIKTYSKINFEWNIFGMKKCHFAEKLTGLKAANVNVNLKGIVNAETLVEELLYSDLFIHTSYIDNSPNSVCEAQILGLPVISTNVGGISSLIEDNKTGILVPANDPWFLASKALDLFCNWDLSNSISKNAIQCASSRHDPIAITNSLKLIYQSLIENKKIIS